MTDQGAADLERRFAGIARLYGPAALQRFQRAHVAVVGVGGVGSWAAEALARSAIGRITLIDLDMVAESNVNRQVHALDGEFGKAKVSAMAQRIQDKRTVSDRDCDGEALDVFWAFDMARIDGRQAGPVMMRARCDTRV